VNDYDDFVTIIKREPWRKRLWRHVLCVWAGSHKEELYRKRQDHRVLLWVCSRCGRITRQMKLSNQQLKLFRSVTRVY
jgi:hypothetical protein